MDRPGWSGPDAPGIKVERRHVLLKVHVQPFTASRLGVPDCVADKLGSYAPPLMLTGDLAIEQVVYAPLGSKRRRIGCPVTSAIIS
jgi:hypothetical protein